MTARASLTRAVAGVRFRHNINYKARVAADTRGKERGSGAGACLAHG